MSEGEGDRVALGTAAGTFVGRSVELARLSAALEDAREGKPRVVLIEGPAGIGKTALLEQFLAGATGLRVLRASGAQEEHLLPFGLAQQLASSARVRLPDRLGTLGPGSERHPEPFTVGMDLVELIGGLQKAGPVVAVIDDVQWADQPSLLAILFALRRLLADRVLALLAARDADTPRLPEGLLKVCSGERGTTLHLAGLDAGELQMLATLMNGAPLSSAVAEHLREHTGGSPLHLRALLQELPPERLRHATDAPLPCPRPFAMQVLTRLGGCTPDAQRLVLATSVVGLECALPLAQRLASIPDALLALEEAISAELLEARDVGEGHGVCFPHALIRAAVYQDIGPARRANLHLRAAELVEDEAASLRHRSAAAVGQDDTLATDLAEYADREQTRGAWSRAAAALLRASGLSSSRERREHRLLDGVDCLLIAGEIARATTYAQEMLACSDGPYRDYALGRLAHYEGRLREAQALLLSAWQKCDAGQDAPLASKIAAAIAIVLVRRARGPELVAWAHRAIRARGTALPHAMLAYGLAYSGRGDEGLAGLTDLPDTLQKLSSEQVDTLLARGLLRFITDNLTGARSDLSLVLREAERWGPFYLRFVMLSFLSNVEYRIGDWDAATAHGEAAVSIAEATDQDWILSWMHAAASLPLSARGQWEEAESRVSAATEYARAVNDENSIADAALAAGHLAAARGDPEAVVAGLTPILLIPEREGIDEPGARWPWQELYSDALVSLRRLDEAEEVVADFEQRAAARGRRSAMVNASRVRGNLEVARGHVDAADTAFCAGFAHSAAVTIPFDRARLEEAYGRFQRRNGRRSRAVGHLKAARALYSQLGAKPYLERCEHVLSLCGVVADRREKQRTSLTPPEVAVARLVSQGLSNRDVAARLVVSVNTVEYHLKNIYAKLGIYSRRQLAVGTDEAP